MPRAKTKPKKKAASWSALLVSVPAMTLSSLSRTELLKCQIVLEKGTQEVEAEIASKIEALEEKLSNISSADAILSKELARRLGGTKASGTPRKPTKVGSNARKPRAKNKTASYWHQAILDMLNGFSDGIQKQDWLAVVEKKTGRNYTVDYQVLCNLLAGKKGPAGVQLEKAFIKSNGKVGKLGAWKKTGNPKGSLVNNAREQLGLKGKGVSVLQAN